MSTSPARHHASSSLGGVCQRRRASLGLSRSGHRSVTNEAEPVGPHDPMHYAPRRLCEEPEQRLAAADDIRALREKRPETVGRTISTLAPLDSQLKNAVYESLRRPLDSRAMSETRALAGEMERRGTLFGVADRLVAARGAATG
jgi:hypothetical protein